MVLLFFFYPFPSHISTEISVCSGLSYAIKLCGRPQHQLNVDTLNKDVNICSKAVNNVFEHL